MLTFVPCGGYYELKAAQPLKETQYQTCVAQGSEQQAWLGLLHVG